MIKKGNTRIIITCSQQQANWLKKSANKLNISVSKFIKWLIDKNIGKIINQMEEKDFKQLLKIAKMPWIDFDEHNNYEWDEEELRWKK